MIKVGLTGGYASGKSFVAAELERLGSFVISADKLGHETLEPSGEAYQPTLKAFGKSILAADGTIDRGKLGMIVFNSPELLEKLNGFVHPAVFRLEDKLVKDFQRQNPAGIAVIEAAILIETGRSTQFDRLIVTTCEMETQIARAIKRDHLTRDQVLARLARQMPLEEKKKYASYLIDTGGSKENTAKQVQQIYSDLKRFAEASQ